VKALAILAALICACQIAAAQQQAAVRFSKHQKPAHGYARAVRPIAIPHQIAPPQEAFASLPEKTPALSAAPSDCDLQLAKIAIVQPLGELIGPGECGARDAVRLEGVILPDKAKVAVTPPATLRCTMAREIAAWVRGDVAPAAAKTFGAPLRGLENLGSYECRGRDRARGATLSEHGRANALDVRSFKLANGKMLVLADSKVSTDFRDAVRASACAHFMTVLGPGSDGAHSEHVHIDLAPRRNNYKICEWDVRGPAAVAEGAAITPADVPLPRPRPIIADAGEHVMRPPVQRSGRR